MHGEKISPLLVGGPAREFVASVEEKFATSAAWPSLATPDYDMHSLSTVDSLLADLDKF